MDTETAPSPPSNPLKPIFFSDRGLRAGWRLLIFLVIVYGVPSLIGRVLARLAKGQPAGPPPSIQPWIQLIAGTVAFLWVLFVTWIMSRIEHRRVGEYGLPLVRTAAPRFLTGYFLWGFLPLALVLLVLRAFGVFYFGTLSLHGAQILSWAGIWALVFLSVGLFEEFTFRGYLLHTLADGLGFWPAAIVLALGFGYVHMGNPGETRVGIAAASLFALFAAVTLWRTGNLWLAVGAHAGWDWGQSFFFGVSDSGLQVQGHLLNPHIQGPDWLTGGSVGPEGSVVTLVLWALMTLLFILLYRPRGPALVITADRKN
jgi:membrane protease YdiL (CAAX protease family)